MTQTPIYFLLVDDLEENLLSLEVLLRREGLVNLKARSGQEALELMLQHEIALAFLDVQMPDMDGFELAELMRGTQRTRRVPIIFVTAGTADRQRRFRGYEAGAVDFIQKPIEPDILRSKADVFFELHLQRQQLEIQRDELKALADALKENDRRKDEFLATLAHELRNPLAPIRNGLYIMRTQPNSPEIDKLRDVMDRQLDHLVRLIDDLMDVSRVSKGKIDLLKKDITLESVIEAAIEASRPLIDSSRHQLIIKIPENKIWLNADLTRLAQVINNLLNNAAKYTPSGGKITLEAREEGAEIVISVTDNGIGIPSEMLPKVFDLFTQVDQKLERSQGGLGIGLALVKRLVEMHGGTIQSDSPGLGKGSVFTIRLPHGTQNPENPLSLEMEIPESSPSFRALNILVVDDNIDSAKTTGWMLELMGHQPVLRHEGLDALKTAKEMKPDIIILDIGLPGMNGYDICRELRKDPLFKRTILIAQTGWGQARDKQLAMDAGFNHHVVKPVKMELLANLVTSYDAKGAN